MYQKYFSYLFIASIAASCGSIPDQSDSKVVSSPLVACKSPRPEMCVQVYDPVCGQNSAAELKTYSNSCTACSDKNVVGYRSGECE